MKNAFSKLMAVLMVVFIVTAGTSTPAMASTQEIQGTTGQTKDIPVSANITSVYSVSLPASISLVYGTAEDAIENTVEGYWYNLRYGAVGKLTSAESVYVEAVLPCTLRDNVADKTVSLIGIKGNLSCRKTWSVSAVGTCDYDGISLTNCVYSYSDYYVIGVRAEDIDVSGS